MKNGILVLMSSYNGETYIEEQVLSIINQKVLCDVSICIRDDGSQDKTCDIIEKLIEKFPDKISLVRGNNIGYNNSFFELIKNAEGYEYYAISDQDDVWEENKLEIAIEWLKKESDNIPLLYASTSYLVGDDMTPYGTTRKKIRELTIYNTIIQNICPGHTQVMNNKLLSLLKKDIDISNIYVYDSWITNTAMLYGKISFDNNAHTLYRQHRKNQLGYGNGAIGQLIASARRMKAGDGIKYRKQIKYFIKVNEFELRKKGYYEELNRYISSEKLIDRMKYLFIGKLYRQKKIESIAFYITNLVGRF